MLKQLRAFCLTLYMKLEPPRLIPSLICLGIIGAGLLLQALPHWAPGFDLFRRLEWITYDWRMKQACAHSSAEATSLGAVLIDEESLTYINRQLGFQWPWPRQYYGRLVKLLKGQGAQAIGFDILFSELHPPNPQASYKRPDGTLVDSDEYFAQQLQAAGNVTLGVMSETSGDHWVPLMPADVFRTNAWSVGHISSEKDSDGVLRRVQGVP